MTSTKDLQKVLRVIAKLNYDKQDTEAFSKKIMTMFNEYIASSSIWFDLQWIPMEFIIIIIIIIHDHWNSRRQPNWIDKAGASVWIEERWAKDGSFCWE